MTERYFENPVKLTFDPSEICRSDVGVGEEGVRFREVWRDPLARLFWLAIKSRHITNQYFRRHCITTAEDLRMRPPITFDKFHFAVSATDLLEVASEEFREQLYPYVVRVMVEEETWPKNVPCPVFARTPLRWTAPTASDASPESAAPAQHTQGSDRSKSESER